MTSAGKLCLEMTHNALVQLFLSDDFIAREQSADNISKANFSKWEKQKNLHYVTKFHTWLNYAR